MSPIAPVLILRGWSTSPGWGRWLYLLAAEGRGVIVTWIRVSAMLINYVNLLEIGDIMRFDGARARARESQD